MDRKGLLKRNFKSPPLKDTVTIPSGGYTIFRFYANNPGIWMMHCKFIFKIYIKLFHVFLFDKSNNCVNFLYRKIS